MVKKKRGGGGGEEKTEGQIKKEGGKKKKPPALPCLLSHALRLCRWTRDGCARGCGGHWEGDPGSGGAWWGEQRCICPGSAPGAWERAGGAGRGHQEPWECRQPGLGQLKEHSTRNTKLTHSSSMTGGGCRRAAKPCFQENFRTEQHLHWTTAQFASCCSAGLGTLLWTLVWAGRSVPDLGWILGPLCVLLSRPLAVLLCCLGWWLRTRSHKRLVSSC